MDIDGLNGGGTGGPSINQENKNAVTGTTNDAKEIKYDEEYTEEEVDDTEEEVGEEEEEEEEEDTEDDNDEIVDRIIEESPSKRFQKRNRRFPRPPPGVDEAFLSLEPETGKEYIWNEIYVTHEEVETENQLLSIVRRLKKNYHPFLIRFYEIWISPAKKGVTSVSSLQNVTPQIPEATITAGIQPMNSTTPGGIVDGSQPLAVGGATVVPGGAGGGPSVTPSINPVPSSAALINPSEKNLSLSGAAPNASSSTKQPAPRGSQRQLPQPRKIAFITERLVEGTLKQYISNSLKTNRAWKRYVGQILSVLRFLYNYGLTHGHLTNDNIFLQSSGALKVGTFALDEFLSRKCVTDVTQNHAISRYLAPEYFQQHDTKIGLSHKGDVYALGVLALEVAAWDPSWETLFSRNEKSLKETTPTQTDNFISPEQNKTVNPSNEISSVAENVNTAEGGTIDRTASRPSIGQGDREKVLNLLNLVTDVRQKNFIECCLRANPSDRPSLRSLINHPAMIEVPSLRLLSAKVIVRSIRAWVVNASVPANPPKGEDKPKADRDLNQKFTETLATVVDELTGHLENDTIIVEIQFRRGNTVRQRTWKDFNFVDSTKKFLDDVRNGYYLLFGCKPPYHQGEQVDSESETLTASASVNGLSKLFPSKVPSTTVASQPVSGCTPVVVTSRRGSFEQDVVALNRAALCDTGNRMNDYSDEKLSPGYIPHSISEPQIRSADLTLQNVPNSSKPNVVNDSMAPVVDTLVQPNKVEQVMKLESSKAVKDKTNISLGVIIQHSDDTSSQLRTASIKPNISTASQSSPVTYSSVIPSSVPSMGKPSIISSGVTPQMMPSTAFMEDVSFGYHTLPVQHALFQRQFSEPRHVINSCTDSPYSIRGRHSEMGVPRRYIFNPSHEYCYTADVVCAVATTSPMHHAVYGHEVSSYPSARSRLYSNELYPSPSILPPFNYSQGAAEQILLSNGPTTKYRKRVSSLGPETFISTIDPNGAQIESNLTQTTEEGQDGKHGGSLSQMSAHENPQFSRMGTLNCLLEEPVDSGQTLRVDVNLTGKDDSDVEGLGHGRLPLTPEANSSILEQYVDSDEEKGEEVSSEVHLFAQRIDMERPRTVEISARAGEEKLADYRHCIIELCEFSYVGCGRWQLSLHFYLLNEKMTEQIKRTVHSQHLAYDWHRADVIVKNLYTSGVIRKEQVHVFLRHVHLAAHNKPTREFQLREGEIGNEHKGRVDPNDLRHRLQVLSDLLTQAGEEEYYQSRNYYTQPPGTTFQALAAVSKACKKISSVQNELDDKDMVMQQGHPDCDYQPVVTSEPLHIQNGHYIPPGSTSFAINTSTHPNEAPYCGFSPMVSPSQPQQQQSVPRSLVDSSTSPLPTQSFYPFPLPPGYYYPGNMATIPYGYAALSSPHAMEPHPLSSLSIPYVISPTGTLPAFYPSYVPPVEGGTVLYYSQPYPSSAGPYAHPGFRHDLSNASPHVASPSSQLKPVVQSSHPSVIQGESLTTTATTVLHSCVTPNNEGGMGSATHNQQPQVQQASSKNVASNNNQMNVQHTPSANCTSDGLSGSIHDMNIEELMQRLMSGEQQLPISHLGYLVPKNPQCSMCDDHHYLHRTDVAIYLASPCYHCREYFAKKAGLTPLAFMNLHYEYKIPWPGFLMVRCGVPTTKYALNQITDYDCKIRRRDPCVCFAGQVLPPCTEFSWSYHRPKTRKSSINDSSTPFPSTSAENSKDKEGATHSSVEQQKRHSMIKQDSQEDGATGSVKHVLSKKEQSLEEVLQEIEVKEKVSDSSPIVPATNSASNPADAPTTTVDSHNNTSGTDVSGNTPAPSQGNQVNPQPTRPATSGANTLPFRGEFSDWNTSQLSSLRVCHDRHPAGGQTLCSHGILVPPEARDDTFSNRSKVDLTNINLATNEGAALHGRTTNSATPSTAGESTPGIIGCGIEMGGAGAAGAKKKKKRVRKLSGLQQ